MFLSYINGDDLLEKKGLKMNLQLFAESSGEKTEKASPQKREKAREEGQVVKSVEITTAMLLVGMFALLKFYGPRAATSIREIFLKSIKLFYLDYIDKQVVKAIYKELLLDFFIIILPILGTSFLIAFLANAGQVGLKLTPKALKPKLSNLNPINGFKRIFSLKTIIELIKSIFKISIICIIVYNSVKNYDKLIMSFFDLPVILAYRLIFDLVLDLGIKIGAYFIFVAAIDYIYLKLKQEKDLMMTKQEVKEEYKMSEGNPEIKSKIKQKMREMSTRRMMQDLPKADVIITNPTHFAVALAYDELSEEAPKLIAKGQDLIALKIKEKAREHSIEIVENKGLARAIYYTVEIGDEIPPQMYQAVAEILAMVFTMNERG